MASPQKIALCVGGTAGIGKAIALRLAEENVSVIIAGRSEKAGSEVVEQLKQINPQGSHRYMKVDATLMKNIHSFCKNLSATTPVLNYCILTQGMATIQGRNETAEGIDAKLALHYYGRMLFVRELIPLLKEGSRHDGDARVLSVLSAGVHKPYLVEDDLALKNNFSISNAANAAGFYNDLALDEFSREYPDSGITFIHAAPGFVRTTWGNEMPFLLKLIIRGIQVFGMSPEKCADNMVFSLTSPEYKGGFKISMIGL